MFWILLIALMYMLLGIWQWKERDRIRRSHMFHASWCAVIMIHAWVWFIPLNSDVGYQGFFLMVSFLGSLMAWWRSHALMRLWLFPIWMALSLCALFFEPQALLLNDKSWSPWLVVHVVLSLSIYALFPMILAGAIILWIMDWRLQQARRSKWMMYAPPLLTLERSLFQSLNVGFILLSTLLLTSMVLEPMSQRLWSVLCAWGVFGGLLWWRQFRGLRGRMATYGVVLTMFLLGLVYLLIH
jgi:ABC-type uncharacterized transport system permease subunit